MVFLFFMEIFTNVRGSLETRQVPIMSQKSSIWTVNHPWNSKKDEALSFLFQRL